MIRLRLHTCFVVVLSLLALLVLVVPASAESDASRATLVVTGSAQVSAAPDMAIFHVGVDVTAETVEAARQANAEAMQRVRSRLLSAGARESDLQTRGFNVNQEWQYNREDGSRTLIGYRVTHTLEVRVLELNNLGDWLDAAMAEGANQISGLTFGVKDTQKMEAQALAEAVKHARKKAEVLAEASGLFLKGILHVSEQVNRPASMGKEMAFSALTAADRAATPISTGDVSVDAVVSITYEI